MSEEKKEAKVYLVDYICDDCGKGKMRQEGNTVLLKHPSLFRHKCDNCGVERYFTKGYPATAIEEK